MAPQGSTRPRSAQMCVNTQKVTPEESTMALSAPFPELDELLVAIGEAGQRLSDINASEGAAGNISAVIGWPVEVRRRFPLEEATTLPLAAPALAGTTVLVTGS